MLWTTDAPVEGFCTPPRFLVTAEQADGRLLGVSDPFGRPCPCGSGAGYQVCCEPLHHGERQAETAEELMRSRYAAYSVGDADYLFRTWHPRTRPVDVTIDADLTWHGLEIADTVAGGIEDDRGEVEFTARYEDSAGQGSMHERSQFERRAGRWFYLTGVVH